MLNVVELKTMTFTIASLDVVVVENIENNPIKCLAEKHSWHCSSEIKKFRRKKNLVALYFCNAIGLILCLHASADESVRFRKGPHHNLQLLSFSVYGTLVEQRSSAKTTKEQPDELLVSGSTSAMGVCCFGPGSKLVQPISVESLDGDLLIQEWMRELRRVKRAPARNVQPMIVVLPGFNITRSLPNRQDLLYPEPLKRRRAKRARYCPILVYIWEDRKACAQLSSLNPYYAGTLSAGHQRAVAASGTAVVLRANGTGRCVISADQASHFCGMDEEGKQL
ncbi:hypothetical protein DICVIV_06459 [Dictyocaulus viviparus]|uniref:Uncharacterized protein n=1 Tax=Dictyocaulus viviparus TaxID=29172 RepID=A0A0D8XUH0_DICVI|nr:hypothetical protein DICVIV_06459 [Dictyocaulus viviparus]